MTYSGSNGTWTGQFASTSLPKLQAGTSYVVVVTSKDRASPVNAGFGLATLSPSSVSLTVSSTTAVVTSTQTVETIPDVVYAALAVLLIIGVLIGYIVRIPKGTP
jgi:tetrahydromethanopterin S-methyltransferase subunit C